MPFGKLTLRDLDRIDINDWNQQVSRLENTIKESPKGDHTATCTSIISDIKRELLAADMLVNEGKEIPERIRQSIETNIEEVLKTLF